MHRIKYIYDPTEAKKTSTSVTYGMDPAQVEKVLGPPNVDSKRVGKQSISIDWRPGIGYDVTAKKFFLFTGAVKPDEYTPPGAKVVYAGPYYQIIVKQEPDSKGGIKNVSSWDFQMYHLRHFAPLNNYDDTTTHALTVLAPGKNFSNPAEGKAALQTTLNAIAAVLMQNGGGPMTMAEIAAKQQIAQAAIGGRVERVG
jgi:hypothetical protein